jgi:DNA-binding TFAR19-related protein (PDSD5 family)
MGKDFSFEAEYAWWQKRRDNLKLMHKDTKQFVHNVLFQLAVTGQKHLILEKHTLKTIYENVGRNISCLANYTMNNQ